MKIIIIGANCTIGKKVAAALAGRHEIIKAGRSSGDITVDITQPASVEEMYRQTGNVDAVISLAGDGHFGPLEKATDSDFRKGVDSKLMGQVNLVLAGQHYLNRGGSSHLHPAASQKTP